TILRLLEPTSGQVFFQGEDIAKLSKSKLRRRRRHFQMIFQDPFASLDPRKTISQIISEPLLINQIVKGGAECEKRVLELMDTVGLAHRWYNTYPHQLDGGRRQRIGIARALAVNPKLIICDEPVSALDVSIQAQILNLLKDLQEQMGLTCIFITHDLSVVHHFSDEIAVMYLGHIVEKAPAEELFASPLHPYTRALLSAIPVPDLSARKNRIILQGEVTSPIDMPDQCRFRKRCYECMEVCSGPEPGQVEVVPEHFVACYRCNMRA
ncbi:MAG: oligopeptide/dipeptide ABC transporter ATP-binding protein, partial [Lawsonibacter sp.]